MFKTKIASILINTSVLFTMIQPVLKVTHAMHIVAMFQTCSGAKKASASKFTV